MGQIRKFKKNELLQKHVQGLFQTFLAENTRFFEYYVSILALKLGDNQI